MVNIFNMDKQQNEVANLAQYVPLQGLCTFQIISVIKHGNIWSEQKGR